MQYFPQIQLSPSLGQSVFGKPRKEELPGYVAAIYKEQDGGHRVSQMKLLILDEETKFPGVLEGIYKERIILVRRSVSHMQGLSSSTQLTRLGTGSRGLCKS